jgi:hypothetical protein
MRAAKLAMAVGISALMATLVAAQADAQSKRPPGIRIYSENGDVIGTSTYVTPAIQVSENAYVFAVAIDLDGQIQVLHPDFPGISVKLLAHREVRLPNFFAGFNQQEVGGYYSASYYDNGAGYMDARGTVIALASRAPFNLERIEVNGDWNMTAIRRLVDLHSPEMAAQALAAYLGAKGEPIGRDIMRFAGGQRYAGYGYGYNSYSACDGYYGYGSALLRQAQVFSYINYLNAHGVKYRIVAYDLCGIPVVVPSNRVGGGAIGFPVTRPPRQPGDTTVFPKNRAPNSEPRRHPNGLTTTAAEAAMPIPRRSGLPQMGDVTINAPPNRRGEPRTIIDGYRPSPGIAIPQGRAPIERPVAPRSEPSAVGAQPAPQYRPEPRIVAPPPSRVPEAPRASPPPPTVHSAPVSSPPPRAEAPAPRSEPARTPPPNRQ